MSVVLQAGWIVKARVVCYDIDQVGVNVLHYLVQTVSGGPPNFTDSLFAADLDADLNAVYKNWLNNGATYRGIGVQVIWPTPFVEQIVNASAGAGVGGATALPRQVSGLITLRSGLAGRANRGRVYPPFPPTAWSNASGDINAGGIAALTAIQAAIPVTDPHVIGGTTTTMQLGAYHRVTKTITPIGVTTAVQEFATQRRRGQLGRVNTMPF